MHKDIQYLEQALTLAGGSDEMVKCGVLLIKGDEIIAGAYNSQRADKQTVNHAEIKAVQAANRQLNSRTLRGITAYCSCEPCVMCLTALSIAKVDRIVYAKTMKELIHEDPMADIDAATFIKQLNFIPKLEHLVVS